MIFIFYYINNNLNISHIIVFHYEAERYITIRTTYSSSTTIEIEHSCISIIIIVTAAPKPKFSVLPITKISQKNEKGE